MIGKIHVKEQENKKENIHKDTKPLSLNYTFVFYSMTDRPTNQMNYILEDNW